MEVSAARTRWWKRLGLGSITTQAFGGALGAGLVWLVAWAYRARGSASGMAGKIAHWIVDWLPVPAWLVVVGGCALAAWAFVLLRWVRRPPPPRPAPKMPPWYLLPNDPVGPMADQILEDLRRSERGLLYVRELAIFGRVTTLELEEAMSRLVRLHMIEHFGDTVSPHLVSLAKKGRTYVLLPRPDA